MRLKTEVLCATAAAVKKKKPTTTEEKKPGKIMETFHQRQEWIKAGRRHCVTAGFARGKRPEIPMET